MTKIDLHSLIVRLNNESDELKGKILRLEDYLKDPKMNNNQYNYYMNRQHETMSEYYRTLRCRIGILSDILKAREDDSR